MDVVLEKKMSGYQQIALEKLENILLQILSISKDLVIEPSLVRILDSFANMTWLKSKGFEKIYLLSSAVPPKRRTMVYMIFSNLVTFKQVLDQISILSSDTSTSTDDESLKGFHIIVVPGILHSFQTQLEIEGLQSKVNIYRFSYDFIKVDQNLYSLEYNNVFSELFIKQDKSILSSIAQSFRIFNMIHKHPKLLFTCGEHSENVVNMLMRMERMRNVEKKNDEHPDFDAMIVIDRDFDYASCLLTPVIYSGLMVELFDVKAGILNLEPHNKIEMGKLLIFKDEAKVQEAESSSDIKSLRMCGNSDELYTSNKFRHFSDVLKKIKFESKSVNDEKRKYSRDMNIEQMKEFVEECLPKVAYQKKILFKHLIICEKIVQELSFNFEKLNNVEELLVKNENRKQIIAYLEETMATNAHKYNILRLASLFHIFCGFPTDHFQRFVLNYLNTFGHQNLPVFHNLFKAKLLPDFLNPPKKAAEIKNIATSLTKRTSLFAIDAMKLNLIPESKDKNNSKLCASYVFNHTFIPMIAQLAHNLILSSSTEEFKHKVGNLKMKFKTSEINEDLKDLTSAPVAMKNTKIFIFVIGGITYAEVAACNFIESITNTTIILASDEITCGSNLIKSAFN